MPISESVRAEAPDAGLAFLLADRANDKIRRFMTTYYLVSSLGRVGLRWYRQAKTRMVYTVGVPGDDDLFEDVHQWLMARVPPGRRRAELARFKRSYELESSPIGGSTTRPQASVRLLYDGSASQTVDLDGHRVQVHVERPGGDTYRGGDGPPPRWIADLYRIVFTCHSVEAREAVEQLLRRLAQARTSEPPRVLVATSWDWRRQPMGHRRTLESVILQAGQMERLADDLERFLTSEAAYVKLGAPYHRGYLFEGPPGCGKTSAAKALADHFGLDVYYLSLPVVQDDSRLVQLLNEVEPRSLLVLEDVDVVHAARERSDSQPGVTMSGLLNALDGFVTPHGLITVMTTNNVEVLDAALLRPGRVDVQERVDLADHDQVRRLVRMALPSSQPLPADVLAPVAPAVVIEAIKRHLEDPEAAYLAVVAALRLQDEGGAHQG